VDNQSTDDSAEVTREFRHGGCLWAECGVGAGSKPWRRPSRRRFPAVVNNDMRLIRVCGGAVRAFEKMLRFLRPTGCSQLGRKRACTPGNPTVSRRPGSGSSTEWSLGYTLSQRSRPRTAVYTGSAACCWSAELFEKLKGFDDRLPLGYEDVEIAGVRGSAAGKQFTSRLQSAGIT